jgi:hypothetical protein
MQHEVDITRKSLDYFVNDYGTYTSDYHYDTILMSKIGNSEWQDSTNQTQLFEPLFTGKTIFNYKDELSYIKSTVQWLQDFINEKHWCLTLDVIIPAISPSLRIYAFYNLAAESECFLFLEENNFESKLVKGGINAPISLFEVYERLEKSN